MKQAPQTQYSQEGQGQIANEFGITSYYGGKSKKLFNQSNNPPLNKERRDRVKHSSVLNHRELRKKNLLPPPAPFHSPHRKEEQSKFMNYSEQLKSSETLQFNKLKLQITDYLNRKTVASTCKKSFKTDQNASVLTASPKRAYLNFIRKSSESPRANEIKYRDRNIYQEKKQLRDTKLLEYRRKMKEQQEQEDVALLHKKSFTIKQIKPEKKEIFVNAAPAQPFIVERKYGRCYGSYYQIVAVQKKFENSRYWSWGPRGPALLGQKSPDFQRKYYSRINNPESGSYAYLPKRKQSNGLKMFEGSVLEPWKESAEDVNLEEGGFI